MGLGLTPPQDTWPSTEATAQLEAIVTSATEEFAHKLGVFAHVGTHVQDFRAGLELCVRQAYDIGVQDQKAKQGDK